MDRDAVHFDAVHALLSRIGLELAFVIPGEPAGTAALAGLLTELDGALAAAPPEIASQVRLARTWLADVPSFPDLIARFGEWHPWMEDAVTSWERGFPLPRAPLAKPAPDVAVVSQPPPGATVTAPSAGPAEERRRVLDVWSDPHSSQDVGVLPEGGDAELMRLFCAEAEDLVREVEQGVLVLERQPDDEETVATVFRAFHTLKGNAAVMKLVVLQALAHEVESLLDAARRRSVRLDRSAIDVILAGADVFSRFVAELSHQVDGHDVGRTIALPVQRVIDEVHAVLLRVTRPVGGPPATADEGVRDASLPSTVAANADVVAVGSMAGVTTGSAPRQAAAEGASTPATHAAAPAESGASRPVAAAPAGSVRVDTGKLDALVDLVGELVIAESMVVQGAERARAGDEHLTRSLARLHGITVDLQRTAMTLRMVPIRATFQKMSRLVRDAAAHVGKEIRLVLEGEETELDRTVVEEIGDPLIHMIRNAIDHGIEPPDVREAAGKPPEGTVRLRASHRGGHVVIEIIDDGRGLDPQRIRARAVERGLLSPEAVLDEHALIDFIFAPGFSTAEKVTDLSGRGVGMDVVRRNIERIRGTIRIDSVPGQGTTFTVAIPLTLAIIEGLLVAVGDQRYVIPTLAVVESFRPAPGAVTMVHGRGEVVPVRGRLVPVLRLARLVGSSAGVREPSEGILVAVEVGSDLRCLLVDALIGKQEVVIKSLGETFAGRTGFAGAAILGDGRVGLILDPAALARRLPQVTEAAA